MPPINVKHVVNVSSESKNYEAENLIKSDGYNKWRIKNAGEKQATVTLQFEKAEIIHQLDIGNENSAFIEVLVGKSGTSEEEFNVLLVTSSFMSPIDSRNARNGNRVRIFTADQFSQTVRDQKWDKVKIVCTQPFAKTLQYGISFIKFHSPPSKESKTSSDVQKPQIKFGAFAVKTDSDSDSISVGSLFAQRKKDPAPLSGAAAIRGASRLAEHAKEKQDQATTPKPSTSKRRNSSLEDEALSPKHTPAKQQKKERKSPVSKTTPVSLRKQSTSLSSTASSMASSKTPLKRTKTEPPKKTKEKEISELMKKVTFVMSGFQNPLRSDLRDLALEMGATYKPDWGKKCTHLICAFDNTPKYKEVKGKGRIVKKDWLTDCHKKQKLLPWRLYRLGRAKSPPGSSDESTDEEESFSLQQHESQKDSAPSKEKDSPKIQSGFDDSTDVDTEDEIERFKDESQGKLTEKKEYDNMPTDHTNTKQQNGKQDTSAIKEITDLPDLFTDKHFFLYGKFSSDERRLLMRYITAYDGEMEEYMNEKVHFVVTDAQWDKQFDDALGENPSLTFVKSQWIHLCHNQQTNVPFQKYVVAAK